MPRSTAAKTAHPQMRQEGPGSNTANQNQPLTKRARTALQGPAPALETNVGDPACFETSAGDLGANRDQRGGPRSIQVQGMRVAGAGARGAGRLGLGRFR